MSSTRREPQWTGVIWNTFLPLLIGGAAFPLLLADWGGQPADDLGGSGQDGERVRPDARPPWIAGGVSLTDAGRDLTGPAAQVLRAYRDLDHALHPLNVVQRGGRLTVVCPRTLARDPAATALGAFKRKFPNVAVTMLSNDTDGIGTVVASGQADIGLGGVDEVFDEGVERILLGRQQIVALVPAARSEGEGGQRR